MAILNRERSPSMHSANACIQSQCRTSSCDCRWAFWWELCEMTRRLTLVGIFVVIEQGSMMQVMIGTAFSAAYMLLQMQVAPYVDTSENFLASSCCIRFL